MATALDPNTVSGLDQRQADALKKAGVDTVEKLAGIDPEALAQQTGLGAEDLRKLKTRAAAAMTQRAARARPARRSMTVAWVMLALVVIAVLAVVDAARMRGFWRVDYAQQEGKLVAATGRTAAAALKQIEAAASEVSRSNWGAAQKHLNQAGEEITFLEQIAPPRLMGQVQEARSALGRAQEAVGSQDQSAAERIDEVNQTLAKLAGAREK